MEQERLYVLVNTFRPEDYLLCDSEGEIYSSFADALRARDLARRNADNPWIDVFRLRKIARSDLE